MPAKLLRLPNTLRHPFEITTAAGFLAGDAVIAFDRGRPDYRFTEIVLHGADPGDPSERLDLTSRRFDEVELLVREHDGETIAAKLNGICGGARRAA